MSAVKRANPGRSPVGCSPWGGFAQSGSIVDHKFGYPADFRIDIERPRSLENVYSRAVALADQFDIFHFHARSLASNWPDQLYPSLLDLLALKERRKKIFFHFRGQEIRMASEFSQLNPFHYVHDKDARFLFRKMPDRVKIASLSFIRAVSDGIFVTDPELQSYVPEATIVPRVLPAEEWPFVGVKDRTVPLIVHAPSRRGVKGTPAVLRAVESLRRRHNFEFKLVENLPHDEARKLYEDADIVVDQLRIGWYGVLATEAMALGKPTIAYIREDLWNAYGGRLPIANANICSLESVLETLIQDLELRRRMAALSRQYFLETHSSDVVCRKLIETYNATPIRAVDWVAVGKFMDRQRAVEFRAIKLKASKESKAPAPKFRQRLNNLRTYSRKHGLTATSKHVAVRATQRFLGAFK